jgi:hypothetical protein
MKSRYFVPALLAGLVAAGAAQAEVGVTGDLGTTGMGVHLSVPLKSDLNARFGINALNYSYDGNTSSVDYDFKLKLQTIDALLDWFPTSSQFRLSSGLVYNGNKVDAHAKARDSGTYELNGNTYSAASAGRIDGRIDFRKVSPYLGIGWGNAVAKDKGWGFSADFGVLFQGSPRTSLANSGCTASAAVCDQLAADVAAEKRKLDDEVSDFKAYPVIRFGVSYKF